MYSRPIKTLLSLILCFALVPLAGVFAAWADEGLEGSSSSGQNVLTQDDELDEVESNRLDNDVLINDEVDVYEFDSFEAEDDNLNKEVLENEDSSNWSTIPLLDALPLLTLLPNLETLESSDPAVAPLPSYAVEYRAHVATLGWQGWINDGKTAGTTGRSLAIEALYIRLNGTGLTGSVEYRLHVQNIGWQNWVKDGALSGTTGRFLRAEAASIRLTGDLASEYDIYYRVHAQNIGWMGWAKNGEDAGTVGYSLRLEAIEILLVEKDGTAPGSVNNSFNKPSVSLIAQAHTQDYGWMSWTAEGSVAGTTGRALRLEALCLVVSYPDYSGSVEYRANVSGVGWQTWRSNGAVAGTTGQARQMEAIQIRLTDEMEAGFDVFYRVHVAYLGWLGWAKNGETAGTVGLSYRMEAIQIRLVAKGGSAPGPTANRSYELSYTAQANVAGSGWLSAVSGQTTIGTTGQARQMEAFKITVSSVVTGDIEYRAFVQNDGWQNWVASGGVSGTEGQNKRIEAIQIRLTGNLASSFDVYYRAHCQDWGWLGWAKNGESAGTGKVNLRMEAFQVAIVIKGTPAPGSTSGSYWESLSMPAAYLVMNQRVANLSSPTGWLIAIDSANCLFGVYSGSQGNWTNVYMWSCSPGKPSTPTVKGVFSVGAKGYVFGSGYSCYWWTQFYGDYLIHSLLHYPGTYVLMENTLGTQASDGCVRLDINNAKWVYDNIPTRTTVLSY